MEGEVEGQRRRHHSGDQEDSSDQDKPKTTTRGIDGGWYPVFSHVLVSFTLSLSHSLPLFVVFYSNDIYFSLFFDINYIFSASSSIQTS